MPKKKTNGKALKLSTKPRPDVTVSENEEEANREAATPEDGEGVPSAFACPECSGVLWELKDGAMVRFRCRVGHSYTMASLAEEHVHGVENALWAAMRALEEKAALATRISENTLDKKMAKRFDEQAEADRGYADAIRKMLFTDDQEAKAADKESKAADKESKAAEFSLRKSG